MPGAYPAGGPTPSPVRRVLRRILVFGLIALSLATIVRGYGDPHRVFAFQPFREASTWQADIYRETPGGDLIPVGEPWPGGYSWDEMVKGRGLGVPGVEHHAVGSVDSILDLLQRALDYVATATPRDQITERLIAVVRYRRNDGEPVTVTLTSRPRVPGP